MKRKQITLCILLLCFTGVTYAQIPKLNSYPSATATIFLDFDGHTVNSPYWNGGTPFVCVPAVLTLDQVNRVFNQVSEDFRPFNLNITTDSTVYFAAPANRRQRVIITGTSSWYGSAGGVSYIESFRWGIEVPAFVFSNLLSNNSKMVSEAASHETGHTLGLQHQSLYDASCNFLAEYYSGMGSGEISWAPIMGNSYSRNLTLWHNGPNNYGCSNFQDELSIISSSANGFGFRPDDVGNTTVSAANVNFNGSTFGISGFINTTSDIDMYRITLSQNGRFILNGNPFYATTGNQSPNIDLQVALLNSSGAVINTYNPSTSVQAVIDSSFTAGTYFLRISNTSNSNTGNYGMLGNYTLSGSFTSGSSLPIYSLVLSGNIVKENHELSWKIIADEPIESITIETSADGKTFAQLEEVAGSALKFTYQPTGNNAAYYRLHVVTASQLKYYSNIIALKEIKGKTNFNLLSNLAGSNGIIITSKGNFNWRLGDMNGRSLQTGRLVAGFNRIETTALSNGMYLLQVADGETFTTEKIVKQ